ncbi:MAG: MucR family transcriptional regulator [Proteobacteria bacterium]|nr:MucR family transcriptional regulator [Pseudomonadota bacterium]
MKMKFSTKEEVNAYFDEEKLLCLYCGNRYEALFKHLQISHDITPDEYRKEFGLPWRIGLAGTRLKKKLRKIMNGQRKEGILPMRPSEEHMKKLRKSIKNRRPSTDVAKNSWHRRGLEAHGRTEPWGATDFEEYLRRIRTGRTLTEVGKDDDMPSREVFDEYLRTNLAFREKFERAWDMLPFSVQIRGNRLGLRFEREVMDLKKRGFTSVRIAKVLNVSESVIRGRISNICKDKGRAKVKRIKSVIE